MKSKQDAFILAITATAIAAVAFGMSSCVSIPKGAEVYEKHGTGIQEKELKI